MSYGLANVGTELAEKSRPAYIYLFFKVKL